MSNNSLQLNGGKSEAILIGTPHQTKKAGITHITISGHPTPLSPLVTNLGVKLDSLSFDAHIKSICQTSFYHLRNLSRLRPSLPKHAAESWCTHSSAPVLITACTVQYVQNSAARVLTRTRKSQHITPVLHSLHLLPINQRIFFKVLLQFTWP